MRMTIERRRREHLRPKDALNIPASWYIAMPSKAL